MFGLFGRYLKAISSANSEEYPCQFPKQPDKKLPGNQMQMAISQVLLKTDTLCLAISERYFRAISCAGSEECPYQLPWQHDTKLLNNQIPFLSF